MRQAYVYGTVRVMQLKLSQLQWNEDKYVHYENVSKIGMAASHSCMYAVVLLYPNPELGEQCPVNWEGNYHHNVLCPEIMTVNAPGVMY